MKKYIILLLLLFTSVNLYAITLYTPNGKSFDTWDEGRASYDAAWFAAWKTNNFGPGKPYPNSYVEGVWENGLWEYNCHVFAWNNWQGADRWNSANDMWKLGKPSPYNLLWKYYPDVWYTDSDNPIGIVSYIETTTQSEAAIVTYKYGSSITHSARIVGSGTRYISKWGSCPIVNHPPTEVPSIYGSRYKYYKINPAYRPIGDGDPAGRDWQTINNALNGATGGSLISVLSNHTLSDNCSIQSGVTLKIKSGVNLNLSGFYLKSNSGEITLESGAVVNPHYCIKSGSTIKGFYPTLNSAIANVVSGQTIEIGTSTTLANNITVPSGVTLKRKSTASITMNSYRIIKSGSGSIIIESGVLNSPDIRRQSGSTIMGLYPTITSAFNASGSGQYVHIRGTHTFTNHFTVPSGKVLKTESYSQMKFPSGKYLYVNGTLNGYNTTFTRTSGTWGGIKYQSGSTGSLTNCTINNAYYGLHIYNTSPTVESNNVNNAAIYLNNSFSYFDNNHITDTQSGALVAIYSGSPTFENNTIETDQSMYTLFASNGSDPWFGRATPPSGNGYGYNVLINSSEESEGVIWAEGGSSPNLGIGNAGPYSCGYNSILQSSYFPPAVATGTASIDAAWCWWGQYPAPTCYGDVETENALSSNPGGGSSLNKAGSSPNSNSSEIADQPDEAQKLWQTAMEYYYKQEYKTAVSILRNIITYYPQTTSAYKSLNLLVRIGRLHKTINNEQTIDELLSIVKDQTMRAGLKSKKVQLYRTENNYEKSIHLCNEIIEENPETIYERYALFDLFNLYQKDIRDTVLAANILDELIHKYPASELTLIARSDNGEEVFFSPSPKPDAPLIQDQSAIAVTQFGLMQNFPNPFNPRTKINFCLPEETLVSLSVYDITGRQVARLVNKVMKAGTYSIDFKGQNLSSGIYIYKMRAGNFSAIKRMLLVK